jgi:hypothetical protein
MNEWQPTPEQLAEYARIGRICRMSREDRERYWNGTDDVRNTLIALTYISPYARERWDAAETQAEKDAILNEQGAPWPGT